MAIVFEQPQPLATMQAAATDKLKYEQAEAQRKYDLQQQSQQANIYETAQRQRMAQQGMAQHAYEFEASQGPSARDVFHADQQAAAQDRGFAAHSALQSQALSQSEQMRLSNLERQESYFSQQADQGSYTPEQRAEGLAQIRGLIGPLKMRDMEAQRQATEMQLQQMQDMRARQVTMDGSDQNARGQMAARGLLRGEDIAPDDPTMIGRRFQYDVRNGILKPIVEPHTAADEASYATAHGGASRANIQDAVVDNFRNQFGVPGLSDDQIRETVGSQAFARAVRDEELRRSSPRGATLTENGRAAAETQITRMANADLVRYNGGVPTRSGTPGNPAVTPQRPVWVQEYLQQLSPLERAAAEAANTTSGLGGSQGPLPSAVLAAAMKWKIERDMSHFQRLSSAASVADQPGASGGQQQPDAGGAQQPGQPLPLAAGIQAILNAPRPRQAQPTQSEREAQVQQIMERARRARALGIQQQNVAGPETFPSEM